MKNNNSHVPPKQIIRCKQDLYRSISVMGRSLNHLIIFEMNLFRFRSKYFRGKRIHGDYDIRVEQAEFKELSVSSSTETGVTASIILAKSGNKVVRSFKPDFLLGTIHIIRKHFQVKGGPKTFFFAYLH